MSRTVVPMVRRVIRASLVAAAVVANSCKSSAGSSSDGSLVLTITGLPAGTNAAVTVTRPNGQSSGVVASTTLAGLAPGTYLVVATTVIAGNEAYEPAIKSGSVTVSSGASATFSEAYAVVPATLQVIVTGLPNGVAAPVTVAGPNGFSTTVTETVTLPNVVPGQYTITSPSAIPAGVLYQASPTSLVVTVAPGGQVIARVQYSHPESALTITIDAVHITQGAQGYYGSVPLIADRPGLLRVFLKASDPNSAAPDVRVRRYAGATLINTDTIRAATPGVPTVIVESDGTKSWNIALPEHVIQPGQRLLVDVDPAGLVPLATRANLSFPATGIPQDLAVLSGVSYDVTFVPVISSADGTTGDITVAGIPDLTNTVKLLHPVWTINATVHAPYTFTGGPLKSADENFAWSTLLQQIEQLRQVETNPTYFYGVVHPNDSSGIVGLGYVGQPRFTQFRSAIGWDNRALYGQLGTYAGEAYAHELGHNLSLNHAPCGGASSPDPFFPYAGGGVGRPGYNVVTSTITATTNFDVMSYCAPTWISDYSYQRMLTYLQQRSTLLAPLAPQRAVMLSGAIRGGQARLNPALDVVASPVMPSTGGQYRLEGRDADGNSVFAFSFDPAKVADAPGADLAQFVYTVPLADAVRLGNIRLTGPGIDVAVSPSASTSLRADTTTVSAVRVDANHVRLTWNAERYPMVMVRNAVTGDVLTFGRGGDVVVLSGSAPLAITASDGVRSTLVRLTP